MLMMLADFAPYFSILNVFRYLTFRTAGATATALLFVFMFGPSIIDTLRLKQGKGQPIRDDGPKSHVLTKKGTPKEVDSPLGVNRIAMVVAMRAIAVSMMRRMRPEKPLCDCFVTFRKSS